MEYMSDQVFYNAQGHYIPKRWLDAITPAKEMDFEAIKASVVESCGLEVKKE